MGPGPGLTQACSADLPTCPNAVKDQTSAKSTHPGAVNITQPKFKLKIILSRTLVRAGYTYLTHSRESPPLAYWARRARRMASTAGKVCPPGTWHHLCRRTTPQGRLPPAAEGRRHPSLERVWTDDLPLIVTTAIKWSELRTQGPEACGPGPAGQGSARPKHADSGSSPCTPARRTVGPFWAVLRAPVHNHVQRKVAVPKIALLAGLLPRNAGWGGGGDGGGLSPVPRCSASPPCRPAVAPGAVEGPTVTP